MSQPPAPGGPSQFSEIGTEGPDLCTRPYAVTDHDCPWGESELSEAVLVC